MGTLAKYVDAMQYKYTTYLVKKNMGVLEETQTIVLYFVQDVIKSIINCILGKTLIHILLYSS